MRLARVTGIAVLLFGVVAVGGLWPSPAKPDFSLAAMPRLKAKPLPSDEAGVARTIQFLSGRIRRDPEDFVAQNMLATYYLQRARETSDADYLRRAAYAAQASLASVPAHQNPGGLSALAHTEFSAHNFVEARDHAIELTRLEPDKGASWALLGDTLLELGDYDAATDALERMGRLGFSGAGAHTRLARLSFLKGDTGSTRDHLVKALAFALDQTSPPRETVAWCYWQLGELAFSVGDYPAAEEQFRSALMVFPSYVNALPALGRARAARGDVREAITHYEEAVQILPDPAFVAGLGDLYQMIGRRSEAKSCYALVEQIGNLAAANGAASNRALILFHADHDLRAEGTYRHAANEYQVRRDIYGADAAAWSALKAGKLSEARQAIDAALRLGTQDARLFYHAGIIAQKAGDRTSARDYLKRALALNPRFDPLQSGIARTALENN